MLGISITASAQDGQLAQVYVQEGWTKTREGYWPATHEGKSYWYKIEPDGNLSRSVNGKSWTRVDEPAWKDNDGRLMRVSDGVLMWSEDNGKMWVPVPDRQWRGSDGKTYKIDGGWTVWSRERQ